jgi:hypothetical protein
VLQYREQCQAELNEMRTADCSVAVYCWTRTLPGVLSGNSIISNGASRAASSVITKAFEVQPY